VQNKATSCNLPSSHSNSTMPVLLSLICSSFAVFFATIKFIVPVSRLYYEYTSLKPVAITNLHNIRDLKIWLDACMSMVFIILSVSLLEFTLKDKDLLIIFSLLESSLIIYQVASILPLRELC
jgi:hypothetical protein